MNAYLGILRHYKTYKIRKKLIRKKLSGWWENIFYTKEFSKFVAKKRITNNPFRDVGYITVLPVLKAENFSIKATYLL